MSEILSVDFIERFEGPQGTEFLCPSPFKMDRAHPEILGQHVMIDGAVWRVVGVHRKLPSWPIDKGEKIGLLVIKPQTPPLKTPFSQTP